MQDVHVCMYVCMHVCMYVSMYACMCVYIYIYKFHSETQVPLLLFRRSTHSNPLECSSNVNVEVELTHGTRLGMYGKPLGYSLDF